MSLLACSYCGHDTSEAYVAMVDACARCGRTPFTFDEGPWLLTDTSDEEQRRFKTKEAAIQAMEYPWERIDFKPLPEDDRRNPLIVAFREYAALETFPLSRELLLHFDDCLVGESPRGELAEMLRDVLGSPSSMGEWSTWYDRNARNTAHAGKVIDRLLALVGEDA